MATKNPEAEAANPPKSKKILILVVLLVVLALAAGGGWMFLSSKNATHSEDEEEEAVAVVEPSGPPTYLPLENMVVNLADPGGERVAQVGVTLELAVAADLDRVKAYMPTIRSDVLMLVSQRTADELLSKEGKEKLAEDILAAASRHFRKSEAKKKDKDKKAKGSSGNPLRAVLFSSFIVQ